MLWNGLNAPEAPNALNVVSEPLTGTESKRLRTARGYAALYKSAAKLWKEGLDMRTAIRIVSEAVELAQSNKA